MQKLRDYFLAGSAFPSNEHWQIVMKNAINCVIDLSHGGCAAKDDSFIGQIIRIDPMVLGQS
jgi:hypothetical protein